MSFGLSGTMNDERSRGFYHTHTDKMLSIVYYQNGAYVPRALGAIDDYLALESTDSQRRSP